MVGKITTVSDAEAGFYDDIPVVRANGETDRLGNVDGSVIEDAPAVAPKKGRAPRAKAQAPAKTATKAKAKAPAKTSRVAKVLTEAEILAAAEAEATKKENARLRKLEAKKKADEKLKRQKEAQERKDKAALRKTEREAAAKLRAEQAEQRAADKLAALGFTGDPVADAEYSAVIDEARALAVQPIPINNVDLGWAAAPGVVLTKTGLQLSEDVGLHVWSKTVSALLSLGDVSQFALGDALVYGLSHFKQQYSHVTEALGLGSVSGVKNLVYVSGIWPVDERIEGLSFTHHQEAAWLYRENPAEARNILEAAKYDLRPASWVRDMVRAYRTRQAAEAGIEVETPAQARQAHNDALALLTTEQSERDLALKGSPRKIAKAIREELNAFVDYAERNMEVPAESALRQIARLQHQIDELQGENQILRDKIAEFEKNALYRGDANAAILAGEASDNDVVSITEDDDLLAYLNTGNEDEDEDQDEDVLGEEFEAFGDEG